jgi:ribonuclease HI
MMRSRIHICCDSKVAIFVLSKTTTELALVLECMHALEKLSGSNKVTLVWIPSHHGILGNEEADKLAKEGTNKDPFDQITGITLAVGKKTSGVT